MCSCLFKTNSGNNKLSFICIGSALAQVSSMFSLVCESKICWPRSVGFSFFINLNECIVKSRDYGLSKDNPIVNTLIKYFEVTQLTHSSLLSMDNLVHPSGNAGETSDKPVLKKIYKEKQAVFKKKGTVGHEKLLAKTPTITQRKGKTREVTKTTTGMK